MRTQKLKSKIQRPQTNWDIPKQNPLHHAVVDRTSLIRSITRERYYDFIQRFWHVVVPEQPIWNFHIKVMADALQNVCERIFRNQPKRYDLLFNVPPGSSKSTVGSILLCPWIWTRFPQCRVLGGSFDKDLSLDLGNKSRRVVTSELYRECFPEIEIRHDQDTKGYFANVLGGERRSTSTGAAITGRHAHLLVIDDPIDPAGVRSQADLTAANQWMKETLPSRCVDQSITPLVLIMQRLAVNDPSGELLERQGTPVKHYCLPAEKSENIKPRKMRKYYRKGLLDPVRLPRKVLKNKLQELSTFGYAGQYEQRPVPLSGGMFNYERLVISSAPPISEFKEILRFWDKAATEGDGAYTAGVLMGILKDRNKVPRFWVLDVIRERWDAYKRDLIMAQTAQTDRNLFGRLYRIGMEVEAGSGGKSDFEHSVRLLQGFIVFGDRPTGDKFVRALPFASQVNGGNVGLRPGPWNKAYIEEMKYFGPTCKYVDQMDSSSGAFNRLSTVKARVGAGGF